MTEPTLADRLRDGPRPTPAEALRVARDVALALEALHSAGQGHGGVEPARVELAGGQARLAREERPRIPGRGGDLQDLGRLLEQLLAGAEWEGDAATMRRLTEGRRIAAWLLHPGPGGVQAGEAARALQKVLGGDAFLPPPSSSTPADTTPLAPHRVALRMACQAAGVGAIYGLLAVVSGGLATVVLFGVGCAAGGAALTLAEELARGRPGRRWAAAVLFAALAPAIVLVAGRVASTAVEHRELPISTLGGIFAGARGDWFGPIAALTLICFFPGVTFASSRLRGGLWSTPAVHAGVAAMPLALLAALLLSGGRLEPVILWPLLHAVGAASVAAAATTGLVAGRGLEGLALRLAARDADEAGSAP